MIPSHEPNGAGPLIHQRKEACDECWGCVRLCPVKAIRVVNWRSEVIQEKCVACGLCVNECGSRGHVVRDDTGDVVELLHSDRFVVALLATEFVAALHPLTVPQIEKALDALGFAAVETTLLGEEIVAAAYERLYGQNGSLLTLRSTCPVAVSFVRKYHPSLTSALAPIVPPYVAQARLIRELYPAETAIVYVSPCYARKDEARSPEFDGAVDVAIDFVELKHLIEAAETLPARGRAVTPPLRRPVPLKELSLTDGFPRQTLQSRTMTDSSIAVVRGLVQLDELLSAISAGEAAPAIVDMLNCEGCIDGPAVNPGISLHAKRTIDAAARSAPGVTRLSTRAMLSVLPAVETARSFTPDPVVLQQPTDAEIDEALGDAGFTRDTVIDCGACGWGTCIEHAIAIIHGDSTWDLCFPLQRARLRECDSKLASTQALDRPTGLWGRRALGDRLELELARHTRYGSPLSVAVLAIDDLEAVAAEAGEHGVDAVMAAVGERVVGSLRSTDFAARLASDRIALLLPGISKTEAFAAAEKVRRVVSGGPLVVGGDGYRQEVSVTLSAGIAAAAPSKNTASAVLEAAEAALAEAVSAGGDQVRLAPG